MHKYSPHSNVVIDGFSAEDSKVNVDAITRGNPHTPHTVLEIGVFSRVARGEDGSIHGCNVASTQSWCNKNKHEFNGKQFIISIIYKSIDKYVLTKCRECYFCMKMHEQFHLTLLI